MQDPQPGQQVPGDVAVGPVGGRDHDQERQALDVDRNMPLSPIDAFARIESALVACDRLGGLDRLGVGDRRDRARAASGPGADLFAQLVPDAGEDPGAGPAGEEPVDRLPGDAVVVRQGPPFAAVVGDVSDGVDDIAPRVLLRPAAPGRSGSIRAHSAAVVSEG
ncbi:hypothetical protein GCM10010468_81980 [Actinocorallia longicatena]|uniref:Uncharacterized protein n=1 Tax=Actinocorallia longicatena TaxID=111803 RepID=A0ABP6QS04_9ACTN